MKKYRVTNKHELLKEGIILELNEHNSEFYYSSLWAHNFEADEISEWLESLWIEEIKEPEFTKDDMFSFAKECSIRFRSRGGDIPEEFNLWLKANKHVL